MKWIVQFNVVILSFAFLSACGGSGGGDAVETPSTYGSSSTYENQCAAPRKGIDPTTNAAFVDKQGSVLTEKQWLRAWIDEDYLWNTEVPSNYNAEDTTFKEATAFFDVLKTPLKTASGNYKDRFHFYTKTSDSYAYYQEGTDIGYGLHVVNDIQSQQMIVSYVDVGSPADIAGIRRGASITAIDGYNYGSSSFDAALVPTQVGQQHRFMMTRSYGGILENVYLTAQVVAVSPVMNMKKIITAKGLVGYFQFNQHISTAEQALVSTINVLKSAGIKKLIIDMRYNGGGLNSIANELAFMVAGSAASKNKIFDKVQGNARLNRLMSEEEKTAYFVNKTTDNKALPELNLSEVTILATGGTCSASESLINGLRGIGIKVNLIGSTTCGKPYAFFPADNCGTTYYAINLQGSNNQGFGDYADGFAPTCSASGDLTKPLGDESEGLLSAALTYMNTGSCPEITKRKDQGMLDESRFEPVQKPYHTISVLGGGY